MATRIITKSVFAIFIIYFAKKSAKRKIFLTHVFSEMEQWVLLNLLFLEIILKHLNTDSSIFFVSGVQNEAKTYEFLMPSLSPELPSKKKFEELLSKT